MAIKNGVGGPESKGSGVTQSTEDENQETLDSGKNPLDADMVGLSETNRSRSDDGGEQSEFRRAEEEETVLQRELDADAQYILELERRLAEQETRLQHMLAAHRTRETETQKLRERIEREREKKIRQDKERLFQRLLEPMDNLERSIAAASQGGDVKSLLDGLNLLTRHFHSILSSMGLERFDPTGEQFDPTQHDAVAVTPASEQSLHEKVLSCMLPGYRLDGQVIRPARVVVGKLSV